MLEYFVHLDRQNPPSDLVLATAEIPDELSRRRVAVDELPEDWRGSPAPSELAALGDDFIAKGSAAILILPSALAPTESNWLLNPRHTEFARIRFPPLEPFRYDPRFF
jgi:RES domain-containing protein